MDHKVQAPEAAHVRHNQEDAQVRECVDWVRARRHPQVIVHTERLMDTNLPYAVGLARELHGLGTFGDSGPEFDWEYCKGTMRRMMHSEDAYFALARDETG